MSKLEIYRSGVWYDLCDGHKIEVYDGAAWNEVKAGDWVYGGGQWRQLCTSTLYYGFQVSDFSNPDVNDTNVDSEYADGNNIAMRIWFATANAFDTSNPSGGGFGSAIAVPFKFDLEFSGRGGGSVGVGVVNFDINSVRNITGALSGANWTGNRTFSAESIDLGAKQADVVFQINLPSIGDTFEFDFRVNLPTSGDFQLVPTKSSQSKIWGIDISVANQGEGSWKIEKFT